MTIEHASVEVARKPWGVADLHPWSRIDGSADPVGELWFHRASGPLPALLLKLLFTSEPLSIQVHPDDDFARSSMPDGVAQQLLGGAEKVAGHGWVELLRLVNRRPSSPMTPSCPVPPEIQSSPQPPLMSSLPASP